MWSHAKECTRFTRAGAFNTGSLSVPRPCVAWFGAGRSCQFALPHTNRNAKLTQLTLRPKRILVADDQLPARELLRAILANAGYEVLEATDGAEALNLASEAVPDLILLDIQMPVLDGFGVCAALRADARFTTTPIVAMTASLMSGERARATQAGFSEFLDKPIGVGTLRKTVAALLA